MVVWIWSWMGRLRLEVDENFWERDFFNFTVRFAISRQLLLLQQNTLVAAARSISYRLWVLEISDAARGSSQPLIHLSIFRVETTECFSYRIPILPDEYAPTISPLFIISSKLYFSPPNTPYYTFSLLFFGALSLFLAAFSTLFFISSSSSKPHHPNCHSTNSLSESRAIRGRDK